MRNRAPSPVVVKEMRQGLKSRGFVLGLAGLQLLMVFSMLFYLNADTRHGYEAANSFFWLCIALPLLAIIPLRGFISAQEERKNKTLELILLTRMTTWKIVLGKWQALFYQSLLTFVSVLPYLILRYYLGSVDLVFDLILFGYMLLLSGHFLSFSIFLGSMKSNVDRWVGLIVGIIIFLIILMGVFLTIIESPSGMIGLEGHITLVLLFSLATLFILDCARYLVGSPTKDDAASRRACGEPIRV